MIIIEKIKSYLRQSNIYKKHFQIKVNDIRYCIRNLRYYRKMYFFRKDINTNKNVVYFIIDPNIKHPGLADRLKAIVGSYYIAKLNNFDFKIIFDHPFELNNYLIPNIHNWVCDKKELSHSLQNTRLIYYDGENIPKLSKKIKQYHIYCYIGYDILQRKNLPNYKELWGNLYRELFKPSLILENELNKYTIHPDKYIAIHLRFVNALQHLEEGYFNELSSDNQKENLIQRCYSGIKDIIIRNPKKKILVFSDSNLFLDRIKTDLPVIVLEGQIGHISFAKDIDNVVLKTFLDFYMISNAEKVICIMAPEMYYTVFSYYASLTKGIPYEEYHV